VLVTKLGGVVDHDTAGGGSPWGEDPGHFRTRGKQADIDLAEVKALELLDRDAATPERDRLAKRAIAGQRLELGHREIALSQRLEHGLAGQAGGAHDRNCEV